MKNFVLIFTLSLLLFSCQKKETILETEKKALNSVFNEVVDSIYYKSTENKISLNQKEKKIIVIHDSLQTEMPKYEMERHFKNVKELYFDTISEKVRPKIDLHLLSKEAKFNYEYLSSIKQNPISKDFWNSKYALPGFLIFSKICFDKEKKYGVFFCTYTNGDYYNAKWFLIYIKNVDRKWKLDQILSQRRIY